MTIIKENETEKVLIKTKMSSLRMSTLPTDIMVLLDINIDSVSDELAVRPEIMMYGKLRHQRRNVGFYSDTSTGYNYRSTKTSAMPLHSWMRTLLLYVNAKYKHEFNGILINKYNNGEEYIGRHSDDKRGLDKIVGVVAISYGATRIFRIRDKKTKQIKLDVPITHGSVLQMAGGFQKEYTHEIPIDKKNKKMPRYSLTFRKHL